MRDLEICTQGHTPGWGPRASPKVGSGHGRAENGLESWEWRGWGLELCGQL